MIKRLRTIGAVAIFLTIGACTTVSTHTPVVTQTAVVAAPAGASVRAVAGVAQVPQGELVPIENWKTTLVTARTLAKLGEVREITDAFNFEGRIFAHATLTSQPGTHGGRQFFEVKWFNGDKLVSVQKAEHSVAKTPFYLASSTSGTAIGAGKCRVEIFANGKLLASREFQVTAQ